MAMFFVYHVLLAFVIWSRFIPYFCFSLNMHGQIYGYYTLGSHIPSLSAPYLQALGIKLQCFSIELGLMSGGGDQTTLHVLGPSFPVLLSHTYASPGSALSLCLRLSYGYVIQMCILVTRSMSIVVRTISGIWKDVFNTYSQW